MAGHTPAQGLALNVDEAMSLCELPEPLLLAIIEKVPDKKPLRLLNNKFAALVSADTAALRCTQQLTGGCTQQLPKRFPRVKHIDFQACSNHQAMVQFFRQVAPEMQNLSSLVLSECDLVYLKLPEILKTATQALPGLKDMMVRTLNCDATVTHCCSTLPQLERITVAKSVPKLPVSRVVCPTPKPTFATTASFTAFAGSPHLHSITLSFPLNVSDDTASQLSGLSTLRSLRLYGLMGCSGEFVSQYSKLPLLTTLHIRGLDMQPEAVIRGLEALTGLQDLLWHPMPRRLQDLVSLDRRMLCVLGSMPRLQSLSIRATTAAVMQLPDNSFPQLHSLKVFTPGKPNPLPLLKSMLPLPKLVSLEVLVGVYAPEWALDEEDHAFSFDSAYLSGIQAQPSHSCMVHPIVDETEPGLLPLVAQQPGLERLVCDVAWIMPGVLLPEHLQGLRGLQSLLLHVFERSDVTSDQLAEWAASPAGCAIRDWRLYAGGPNQASREDCGPWPLSASFPTAAAVP